jgi:hypothetical protein
MAQETSLSDVAETQSRDSRLEEPAMSDLTYTVKNWVHSVLRAQSNLFVSSETTNPNDSNIIDHSKDALHACEGSSRFSTSSDVLLLVKDIHRLPF